ncbi:MULTISPECIES: glycosyl hydrolase 108 family protein [unclassified Bacillus (in: firmicutes)]|uniref:glycosyl hydrolase 108 family protein n=1 Tax=unclassified Bacillus (in: firmicutes) TaxID=185979 RepID=UPI0015CF22C1|nr:MULTISPECIES: glycosyl hydrolase 108 family protein [unclassified Bacillus (in: firmicutes)]
MKKYFTFLIVISFILLSFKKPVEASTITYPINQPTYVYKDKKFTSNIKDIIPKKKVAVVKSSRDWYYVKYTDLNGKQQYGWINTKGTKVQITKPKTFYSLPMKTNADLVKKKVLKGYYIIKGATKTGWYKVLYNNQDYFIPISPFNVTLNVNTLAYKNPMEQTNHITVKSGTYTILDEQAENWYKISYNKQQVWLQKIKKVRSDEKAVFKSGLTIVKELEGSACTNHVKDHGGLTKYGITQNVYDEYRDGHNLGRNSVCKISSKEIEDIIYKTYYVPTNGTKMSSKLAIVMLDTAVNFGKGTAYAIFQRAMGIDKGKTNWGPLTNYSFNHLATNQENDVALRMIFERMRSRYNIVAKDPSQGDFLKGWLARDQKLLTKLALK